MVGLDRPDRRQDHRIDRRSAARPAHTAAGSRPGCRPRPRPTAQSRSAARVAARTRRPGRRARAPGRPCRGRPAAPRPRARAGDGRGLRQRRARRAPATTGQLPTRVTRQPAAARSSSTRHRVAARAIRHQRDQGCLTPADARRLHEHETGIAASLARRDPWPPLSQAPPQRRTGGGNRPRSPLPVGVGQVPGQEATRRPLRRLDLRGRRDGRGRRIALLARPLHRYGRGRGRCRGGRPRGA